MKNIFWLILICLVFLITRLTKIIEIPSSLYWDEASIGYNAHAVLKTGRDEWGEVLPLHFRAFGEFKLPVYIYSVALMEKIIGYKELAVRLPAVFYSLCSLVLIFLITRKLTNNFLASLLSAFMFTVSPWGLLITRVGYEVTAGTALFLLAWFLFLKSKERPIYFFLSAVFHILAMYSYNSFRIVSPLFFLFSLIYFLKKQNIPIILMSILLTLVSFYPIYKLYRYDAGGARLEVVALQGSTQQKIIQFGKNYLSHFSPPFLFIYGDTNPRSNFPGYGLLSWFTLPVIVLGLSLAVRSKNQIFTAVIVLLLSPIAASLTRESPHALRSFLMFPALAILFGIGVKNRALWLVAVVFMALQFENYTYNFHRQYNSQYSKDWQLPYKQIFDQSIDDSKELVVSDAYAQPYIFALYYQKYDPIKFRETVIYNPVSDWGFSTVKSFGNFIFIKK